MRQGVLSDEYIRTKNPAFFPRRRDKRKVTIPFYDLFAVAQVTHQNVFERASQMVLDYVPPPPPSSPRPNSPSDTQLSLSVTQRRESSGSSRAAVVGDDENEGDGTSVTNDSSTFSPEHQDLTGDFENQPNRGRPTSAMSESRVAREGANFLGVNFRAGMRRFTSYARSPRSPPIHPISEDEPMLSPEEQQLRDLGGDPFGTNER